jgi:hypothetical protein
MSLGKSKRSKLRDTLILIPKVFEVNPMVFRLREYEGIQKDLSPFSGMLQRESRRLHP